MKTSLTYGFAMAVAGAVLAMVLYLTGLHSDAAKLTTAQIVGTVGALIIGAICITLGTRARRAEYPPNETFSYGRAFGTGVSIALFAALFGILTTFAYTKFVNPEFVDVIVAAQNQKLEARGLSSAQLEATEKMVRKMSAPPIQAAFGFVGALVLGTLISLVTAAFLKRPAAPPALA
jgi:hypothetical protein